MTFNEAKELLAYHNNWRRDNHVPNKYEMVNPTELGKAIDIAVEVLNTCIDLNCNSFNDLDSLYKHITYCKSNCNNCK